MASGPNLLVNGSFEASTVGSNRWAGFSSVPGWLALPGGVIELWSGLNDVQATDGVNHGALDYLGAHDGLSQSVQTVAGQSYTLTFDARSRPGFTAATCTIEVLWNDQLIATVPPGSAWATYVTKVSGTGGLDKLTFREVQSQSGDGLGALYDNLRLTADVIADAPVVAAAITDQTAIVHQAFSFVVPANTFADPNGDALVYSALLAGGGALPSWLAFNPTTRSFSGTPGPMNAGELSVQVTASDGTFSAADTFLLTVATTQSNLLVNGSFEASIVGVNQWDDFSSIPGWTALSGGTIELWNGLNGVTATEGVNYGELDYLGAHDGTVQTVQTVAGQSYTLSFDARSRPGFTAATCAIEVLWNNTVVATVAPANAWTTHTFSIPGTGGLDRLTFREVQSQSGDGLGALYDNVRLVAASPAASRPPVAVDDSATTSEDIAATIAPLANDTNQSAGTTLSIVAIAGQAVAANGTLDVGPAMVRLNANGTLTVTPDTNFNGAFGFDYTASNGTGADVGRVTVNIAPVADAPAVAFPIPDQAATANQPFSYTVPANTVTDADGDALAYSARLAGGAPLPSWLAFNPGTRAFSGTPGTANVGPLSVEVIASDGALSAADTFTLTVGSGSSGASLLSFAGVTDRAKVVDLHAGFWTNATRVLPLGDSNTFGWTGRPLGIEEGYRLDLWQLISQNRLWIDYVGQYQNGPPTLPDSNHHGAPGITATAVIGQATQIATTQRPDVVLLMLGTNDALNEPNASTTVPGDLLQIMQRIDAVQPNVTILLGALPPINPQAANAAFGGAFLSNADAIRDSINAQLPGLASQAQAQGINAVFVPMPSLSTADLYDGVHPNDAGYAEIAAAWFGALSANLSTSLGTFGGARTSISGVADINGSELGDALRGNAAVNRIDGRGGADWIEGAGGGDMLTGGEDRDRFVFTAPNQGFDTVTDFTRGLDLVHISAAGFGAGLVAGMAAPLTTAADAATATTSRSSFLFDNAGVNAGTLYWDANGGSGADAVALVRLNVTTLGSADLFIA